ncbi:MAG: alanine/glycine:cation symporter family protein [Faecousia sp.]
MMHALNAVHDLVWGAPGLVLILGTGVYLTVITGFAQVRLFPGAVRRFAGMFRGSKGKKSGISPFQALCTALAATVGTGNLVGVAGAICLGGPGAIFWMWVCGLVGMATKFAEATLAVRYRVRRGAEYAGGPMYMIRQGMGKRFHFLAGIYSFLGVIAAFGVGNATQINAVVTGINNVLTRFGGQASARGNLFIGLALAVLVGASLLGGAKRIGQTAEKLVPFASMCYIVLCAVLLVLRADAVPGAFQAIIRGALSPRAVTGGAIGSAFRALSVGCSRGVFTNEAGMGTASIAHASAEVSHPAEQGLMGIMEVFLDTIVICTMTALAILCSGVPIPYGEDVGGDLTTAAFTSVLGDWVSIFLSMFLTCFAFATVLGWGLYGARCGEYLFGPGAWKGFAVVQTAAVVLAAVMKTETVWQLAETVNGLMAIPNLIALLWLSPELKQLTKEYIHGGRAANGGTYANIHQCQSMRTVPHAKIPPAGGGR